MWSTPYEPSAFLDRLEQQLRGLRRNARRNAVLRGIATVIYALTVLTHRSRQRGMRGSLTRRMVAAGATILAPAGWYQDPDGAEDRWWDGTDWTNERRTRQSDADG